jgi:hypothetical protein
MDSSSSESELEEYGNQRNEYLFRERMDWATFSPAVFRQHFRCSSAVAELLLQQIGIYITPKVYRNHALDPKSRLLITLRFLGDNDDYHTIAACER